MVTPMSPIQAPIKLHDRGDTVVNLQDALLMLLQKSVLRVTAEERREYRECLRREREDRVFARTTEKLVAMFQQQHGIHYSGEVDEATAQALAVALDVRSDHAHHVEGRILFDDATMAGNVTLRLYHRGFGGAEELLAETKSDEHGFYEIAYVSGGTTNIEVRALDGQGYELPLSATRFAAQQNEMLNLVAPARIRPSTTEYQRLSYDLAEQTGARGLLAAREDDERRDLTLLHRATGWDARLIALAVIAERLGAETQILPEAVYGLLRAGLPTDKVEFAHVCVGDVDAALGKVQQAGIIRLDGQQIAAAKAAFERFARKTLRSAIAFGALSSVDEFLSRSGLSEYEKRQFEDIYFSHRGPADDLWVKAREASLSQAAIDGLRVQGKLAWLTRHNAELTRALQQEIGSPDELGHLVEMDLYRPYDWKKRLYALADGNDGLLEKLIPPGYGGETTAERLEAYAADLAREVRLSFPTRVVERMIANDELSLSTARSEIKQSVVTFLRNAEALGFALGSTPVDAFVAQNKEKVLASIAEAQQEPTLQSVKRIHRLYQITPSDEALTTLSGIGFDSAYEVASFTEDEFAARYGDRFLSMAEAKLVVRKAQQVAAVAHTVVAAARQMDSVPALYALSRSTTERVDATNALIKHYPTIESLFGSADYCDCEHCRSVLSPAAYLVDLLEFLNPDGERWLGFLRNWQSEHGGKSYDGVRYGYRKAFDALIERRPDLPHLPLTCENTQTALPYIDIVNEILEYFVANSKLDAAAAHDTGQATTAELLAEPQNVIGEAYKKLRDARYPLNLPFDLWIETVRRLLQHFETPLWRILDVFLRGDEVFPPRDGANPYYRHTVFTESLGISPSEQAVFTVSDPPFEQWHKLYGYPSAREALSDAGRPGADSSMPDSPIAYYRFDEIRGPTVVDGSGNENHGFFHNRPDLGQPGTVAGGTAVRFNGVDQYVALPKAPFGNYVAGTAAATTAYSLTFETWFNAPPGASGVILGQTGSGSTPGSDEQPSGWVPALRLDLDGAVRGSLFWHNSPVSGLLSPEDMEYDDGQWHHVAVTYADGVETLYIDGVRVDRVTNKLQFAYSRAYDYFLGTGYTKNWFGGNGKWFFFKGRLDHAAIYPHALTAAQIAEHYARGAARAGLPNAQVLARRLGISYEELTQLVQESFVNPGLRDLAFLWKLRLGVHPVVHYLENRARPEYAAEKRAFEEHLKALDREFGQQPGFALAQIDKLEANGALMAVLVLRDRASSGQCNFDQTWLEFGNGTPAGALEFVKINLFVRLWKKLGWTIAETGRALEVFVARDPATLTAVNLGEALQTAIIYLSHLKEIDARLQGGTHSRTQLLTLWSDIAITGQATLYAQLFLTSTALKSDPIFDDPLGNYLQYFDTAERKHKPFFWDPRRPEDRSTGNVSLRSHLVAVQGALGLTADDIARILADARITGDDRPPIFFDNVPPEDVLDTAALSLANVSLLHRYALLAKALKLSMRELIVFKELSGLDPFPPLFHGPLATLDQDVPFTQTLRFIEVVETVRESGLTTEDLDYLLRHRFDDTGRYRSNREAVQALLKKLAEGVCAIRDEHVVPDDPGRMDDETLRQKLGLVFPPDVVERFLAMMNGTVEFTVTRSPVANADQLHAAAFAGESAIGRLAYDDATREQKLVCRGVLFETHKEALKRKFSETLTAGQQTTFAGLLDAAQVKAQDEASAFFEKHLKKQPLSPSATTGFLEEEDFQLLFDRHAVLAAATQQAEQDRVRKQRATLANAFLPFLQRRLTRQFVLQTLTAYTGADAVLVESLVTDERLLADPEALLNALAATDERGVSAAFFDSDDGSGQAQPARPVLTSADTALKGDRDTEGHALAPANSARFDGYLEVPASGVYRFYVELRPGAEAKLRFDHLPDPLFWEGEAAVDHPQLGDRPNEFLELKFGVLYRFGLELNRLNGGEARMLVQGTTLPKDGLAQLRLYPLTVMERAERAVTLLAKALQIVRAFGLSEREIRYLMTHAASFDGLSLSTLPTIMREDTAERAHSAKNLFAQFLRLAGYARVKRDLAGGTDTLIDIFEANATTDDDKLDKAVYPLIAKLTRRDIATIKAAACSLVTEPAVPAFESERPLQRLWDVLSVVERLGVPVSSLQEWTGIVGSAATPEQRFAIARDLRNAVKSRYDAATWQRVAQPIFDKLRPLQRDALAAHVMHQHGFDRIEQLYEYFLIDPGMEPVVQTTRVQLAISSVQTFIQRCLLNLERKVHPSAIDARQWQWMKRYRVWEANRKLFLFPENWLEPEFRDDKTPLFKELEGTLLQGDVSDDLAEDAFLTYLQKLDELARLDIVAMHLEEKGEGAQNTLHVFGRTFSAPHRYFYRHHAHRMWTPWEPVQVEIEGDHLAPVVWRGRLYLFWVTFMEKPGVSASGPGATGPVSGLTLSQLTSGLMTARTRKLEARLHWSEYLQGEWSTHESGPPFEFEASASQPASMFVHVFTNPETDVERGVFIRVGKFVFYLADRNSAVQQKTSENEPGFSFEELYGAPTALGPVILSITAGRYVGMGQLQVKTTGLTLLSTALAKEFILVPCNNGNPGPGIYPADSVKPFFYQDKGKSDLYTFFIEPEESERTLGEWHEWVMRTAQRDPTSSEAWKELTLIAQVPSNQLSVESADPQALVPIDQLSIFKVIPRRDWLVDPATRVAFGGGLIDSAGRTDLQVLPSIEAAGGLNVMRIAALPPGRTRDSIR
jgi:hypothetical protein